MKTCQEYNFSYSEDTNKKFLAKKINLYVIKEHCALNLAEQYFTCDTCVTVLWQLSDYVVATCDH